jgi:hypothetical protein
MLLYRWKLAAVLAVLAIGGTAITPAYASAQDSTAQSKPPEKVKRGGSNYITESEINSVSEDNAFDIIQRLRPSMMRTRSGFGYSEGQGGGIIVYLDNQRAGELGSLRNIQRSAIKEIRFLSGPDATQRFGTGVPSGVILVSSKH